MHNALNAYKKTQVHTVDQGKLVLMLFDGALQFLRDAAEGTREKNIERAHNGIVRTQRIVNELCASLNMDVGGEIARSLQALYMYVNKRLLQANLKKDEQIINEVIDILTPLRDSFREIINPAKAEPEKTEKEETPVVSGERKLNLQG